MALGSTHALTPRQFVDDLKVLELGGVGSKSVPNGIGDGWGKRPLQEYYDEKYFVPDAPPPQPAAPEPVPKSRQEHGRLGKPSIPSFAGSAVSLSSTGGKEKEEKKKKRGLFHF